MNKIISLYRDAVRDDWDKQTDATLANMQEAEQNLLSRLAARDAAVKKVAELENDKRELVEALNICLPIVEIDAKALHILDGFRKQERPYDKLVERIKLLVAKHKEAL